MDLLKQADQKVAQSLATLLNVRTKAGYSSVTSSAADVTKSERAVAHLWEAARRAAAGG